MNDSDKCELNAVASARLRELYPSSGDMRLEGLYLCHDLRRVISPGDAPADIVSFRAQSGLPAQPALVIVSNSLDLPLDVLSHYGHRRIIVVTSRNASAEAARRLARKDIEIVQAGNTRVDGGRLIAALAERRLELVYSIAGPAVMHTLLEARVLRRLYLTTVLRVLGGKHYATMARGEQLDAPYDFELAALYLDEMGPDGIQQLLQVFDHRT